MHRTQRLSKTSLRLISRGEGRDFYPHKTYQLIESFYFTIGLVTQRNLLSKARPYLPVSFRQRDANIANLSASAWA